MKNNKYPKITMVIPTYWSRKSSVGWKEGDVVYDHPTPLDKEGTLKRTLKSIKLLKDKNFHLVVIAVVTSDEIEKYVLDKVSNIIKSSNLDIKVFLFGYSHLKQIHKLLTRMGKKNYTSLLNLKGYANIRNLCLFIPHIFDSDAAVLIDDDEVFEDIDYLSKVKEFIGKNINDKKVYAITGYVVHLDGNYQVKKQFHPWMKFWDKNKRMNEAFYKMVGRVPRLKETPFALGGNMVIHRNLFSVVPFDINISRGEDTDFLINAKMYGFSFFLDNQLSIKHLPPPKSHSTWKRMREDIYRFIYERAKIRNQKYIKGMTRVYPEDFDPYPGCFLKEDLEYKIEKSCRLLSREYLVQNDKQAYNETLRNITLSRSDAVPKNNPFDELCLLQKRWNELIEYSGKSKNISYFQEIIMN